ncbi:F0F1 ATP synthase subunit alpha [Aestuariirhabdus sp. LZHN29]|uniref:F0F1 ATP synthase subunit alpha n=1 Tax=Aestuariirhabdus sp. LZHN29 TaxID=3417462 RepID=UPI003CF817D7
MRINRLVDQQRWVQGYHPGLRVIERGEVISIGDGIVWVRGLPSAALADILEFSDGSRGMVFDLSTERIGVVLLQRRGQLGAGSSVSRVRHHCSIGVGDALLGRVIDPLGDPLDGGPLPHCEFQQPLDGLSAPITAREFVNQPLYTGNRIIDTLLPIGRGQRQLIIGDEGLGRSSIALDTVIHQRHQGVRCVYVLIGQKRSTVANTLDILRRHGALEYTTVVVAAARALPGLQYLAPLAGCAIAEFWMRRGMDTLVVYDDLGTHARLYRELSLLLRRPPGREAYPGDIFSIHARLLERSTRLNSAHGGGSMTALPIVGTLQGEIAAYIPTNLISITDGQIYLTQELFSAGFKPAIDITRSVSRIGGKAQHEKIKQQAGRIKLDYLQFLELEGFTHIGARLEPAMEKQLKRGRVLRELLKQPLFKPQLIAAHFSWLLAYNQGWLDDYEIKQVEGVIDRLTRGVAGSRLTLDHPQEEWLHEVEVWLREVGSGEHRSGA